MRQRNKRPNMFFKRRSIQEVSQTSRIKATKYDNYEIGQMQKSKKILSILRAYFN